MSVIIQLRRDTAANWNLINPILADGEIGVEKFTDQFKIGDGVRPWGALPYGGLVGPAQTSVIQDYGSGEDGDVTISASVTVLTQDVYYNNLTIISPGQIRTNGYRIFVRNTLDLTLAGDSAINNSGLNGGNAALAVAGTGGTAYVTQTLGSNLAGSTGAVGSITAGVASVAAGNASPSNGGAGGTSGNAGTGATAGSLGAAGGTVANQLDFGRFTYDFLRGILLVQGGGGGKGGGAGGGNGAGNTSGAGGGGGASGGMLVIWARTILKSASTAAGAISCKGGNSGNGGNAIGANAGGGAGAGGGGGGYILVYYENLSGVVVADICNASGGNGGNGGNGSTIGNGGGGGNGGNGGRIRLYNSKTTTTSVTVGLNGSVGSVNIGAVGGVGGLGGISKASL